MEKKLRVDIWSDIVCPWCYIGKRRFEGALARFPDREAVSVTWRAFELDPAAPSARDTSVPYARRLATKYGLSVAEAEARLRQMTDLATAEGLAFRFDRIQPGNTFGAHRVLHLAAERGVQDAVKERFLRAYMTEGEPIGNPEVVARMASEAGLELAEVRPLLANDAYAREVRADEQEARDLGITGVPFFVFAERYAVSGAQPAHVLLGALERAWGEVSPPAVVAGAACGPGVCD
jgi:predicted DsbA family dithiol-disulfide isomerase